MEELFEAVRLAVLAACASSESGGVDHAIVGEGGSGVSVLVTGLGEGVDDDGKCDGFIDAGVEEVAGVVIEPGNDFYVFVVTGVPVSEVRLPGFVRGIGLESVPGATGAFVGLRGDFSLGFEYAPYRCY